MKVDIKLLVDCKCNIAECPSYDKENHLLYWVDIFGKQIFRYDIDTKKLDTKSVNKYVSYIVPRKQGGVIIGLQDGMYHYDFDTEICMFLGRPNKYDPYTYRFNDGKCDVMGRIWTGTTAFFEERFDCSLYKVDNGHVFNEMFQGINVSNGLGWSPDNKKMYYIDSGKKLIYSFDFDAEGGRISNKKVIINYKDEGANPDGMTVDSEGMLWICHWGGYTLSRWNPNTGKKIDKIEMPVKQVTCPIFGGKNMSELYVTTARYGCTEDELKKQPHAGSIYKIKLNMKGTPSYSYNDKR